MNVTLLYFDGCPNWHEAEAIAQEALRAVGVRHEALTLRRVETIEDAERLSFRGSPTLLVNGEDPFADESLPVGLACRMYQTPNGLAGTPTLDAFTAALLAAS